MDGNAQLIQVEDWLRPNAVTRSTPVFLIHDGGGTIFAYHCLEELNRPVYGISNPHFSDGNVFEGGIAEMGALYAGDILKALADPDFPTKRSADGSGNSEIILGGWSLGGMLSLEIAKRLSTEPKVKVTGILMIDSLCPVQGEISTKIAPYDTSEEGKTKNQILSQRAMVEARRMIRSWDMPVWEDTSQRPRAILLRAKERVAVANGEGVSLTDVYRDQRTLGWDRYDENMFEEVDDVEGHHYNLFAFERIDTISASIRKALRKLDS